MDQAFTEGRGSRAWRYAKAPPDSGWAPLVVVNTVLVIAAAAGSAFATLEIEPDTATGVLIAIIFGSALAAFGAGLILLWFSRFVWGLMRATTWQRDEAR